MDLKIISRTIEDVITRDSLKALPATLFTVGGIAVQMYGKEHGVTTFRTTSDIDTETHERMPFTEFIEKIATPIMDNLEGYTVMPRKGRKAYELKVIDKQGNAVLIHGNRYSRKQFRLKRDMLERELEKTRYVSIADAPIRIIAPEDIVVTKLDRILTNLEHYNLDLQQREVQQLNQDRIDLYAVFDQAEPVDLGRLQLDKDIHDLNIMGEVELDPNYLQDARNDWPALDIIGTRAKAARKVAKFIPPKIIEALSN